MTIRILYDNKPIELLIGPEGLRPKYTIAKNQNRSGSGKYIETIVRHAGFEGMLDCYFQQAVYEQMHAWWSWAMQGQKWSLDMDGGDDLVTNGTFDADTGWTKGTGWSIAGGVASKAAGSATSIYQLPPFVDQKHYTAIFTLLNYSAGTVSVKVGAGGIGAARSANGTYIETLQCSTDLYLYLSAIASFVGDIDDIICFLAPGSTTLDGSAMSHQKVIPLTSTAGFNAGDKCLIRSADWLIYEVVEIASVSAGVSVTAVSNLKQSYVSGDQFRHLRYFPYCVLLDEEEFDPDKSGDFYRHRFRFAEVSA